MEVVLYGNDVSSVHLVHAVLLRPFSSLQLCCFSVLQQLPLIVFTALTDLR